jgi:hypothetical protein
MNLISVDYHFNYDKKKGWITQLVNLVELRVKELKVRDSSPDKEEKLIL